MGIMNTLAATAPGTLGALGTMFGGQTGGSVGTGIGNVIRSIGADNEREAQRSVNYDNYGIGGVSDEQAAANQYSAAGRGTNIGSQSNTDMVGSIATDLMKTHGLDANTANIMAQKAAESASKFQQQLGQSQAAFESGLGNVNANLTSQRQLINKSVDAAANNVANQLNSLTAARNSANTILMGSGPSNIGSGR